MTPKLLILVLTASLIAHQGHCEEDDSSGDAETELLDPEVTVLYIKSEEAVTHAKSDAQVILTQTSAFTSHPPTITRTHNGSHTNSTESPPRNISGTGNSTLSLDTVGEKEEEDEEEEEEEDDTFTIILAVLALVMVLMIVVAVVLLIICRRRRAKAAALERDLYLDAEGREKVPMPMFEDDVPSVLELEMEDLEKWMIKGDTGLSTERKQFS